MSKVFHFMSKITLKATQVKKKKAVSRNVLLGIFQVHKITQLFIF